jgi:hypothetical protein
MAQVGSKQNSILNGEWAKHVRNWYKRYTAGRRRTNDKQIIKEAIKDKD